MHVPAGMFLVWIAVQHYLRCLIVQPCILVHVLFAHKDCRDLAVALHHLVPSLACASNTHSRHR